MLGMNKSYDGCWRLLEMTTLALDQKALQMMLTSAQEVNIALCVRCAVEEWVSSTNYDVLLKDLLQWSLISQTDKVHNSLLPISTISKLELEKLVWWFPHHRVSENFMWKFIYDWSIVVFISCITWLITVSYKHVNEVMMLRSHAMVIWIWQWYIMIIHRM